MVSSAGGSLQRRTEDGPHIVRPLSSYRHCECHLYCVKYKKTSRLGPVPRYKAACASSVRQQDSRSWKRTRRKTRTRAGRHLPWRGDTYPEGWREGFRYYIAVRSEWDTSCLQDTIKPLPHPHLVLTPF
uniref:putative uncharacterized protein encoded by LINC00615 n=1 Tax=Macaca mulatta TaxID=9544 RepID=UPI0010A2422B|nr:putative uncharacterized protein encoded by LINC00615 [Macaca mulatta]